MGRCIPAGYRVAVRYTCDGNPGTIELEDGSETDIGQGKGIRVGCYHGKLTFTLVKGTGTLDLSEIIIVPLAA